MRINLYEISYNSLDPRFVPKLLLFGALTNVLTGLIIYYFVDESKDFRIEKEINYPVEKVFNQFNI